MRHTHRRAIDALRRLLGSSRCTQAFRRWKLKHMRCMFNNATYASPIASALGGATYASPIASALGVASNAVDKLLFHRPIYKNRCTSLTAC